MRRLLWTLAHAHGALLSPVHAAFAFTYFAIPVLLTGRQRLASALLMTASVLLPGGFFLGGAFVYEGDPGLGIWLVPPGALCLLVGVFLGGAYPSCACRSEINTQPILEPLKASLRQRPAGIRREERR